MQQTGQMKPSPRTWSITLFYLWHLVDGLTHVLFESTYVYGCFMFSVPRNTPAVPTITLGKRSNDTRHFLGRNDRLYGNAYGNTVFTTLWQEYAKADSRYAGIDLTTLSLEIVTVFIQGPLALYVAESTRKQTSGAGRLTGRTWFCAGVLAVMELFGGYAYVPVSQE